jgi:hypothetical protein
MKEARLIRGRGSGGGEREEDFRRKVWSPSLPPSLHPSPSSEVEEERGGRKSLRKGEREGEIKKSFAGLDAVR